MTQSSQESELQSLTLLAEKDGPNDETGATEGIMRVASVALPYTLIRFHIKSKLNK